MNKTIYRIMGIIVTFALALGGFTKVQAAPGHSTAIAVGAGTYDDSNTSAWAYSGTWQTFNGSGPYNNTLYQSNAAGSYAEVTFNGTRFTVTYLKAPGRGAIDVYIDGAKVHTIATNNSTIVWQAAWTSASLSAGTHTVRFVNTGAGWIDLDAIHIYDTASTSGQPVYAYYYLWWSTRHWQDKLGSNYPYNASPLPLPAQTDADGCNPVSNYAGNQLLDVPTRLVSQDEPGAIEDDIRLAKNAGLTGFWLNWGGDGTTSQTRTSVSYTRRLAEAFAASKRVGGFKNWVSYKAAAREPANDIINDLNFLYQEFKGETAWEKIDGKPVVTFTGSRAYSDADVQKISNAVRDRIYLVGDESRKTLTPARLAMFDAITYYWSTQDPYGTPQSFDQIKEMGDKVHAAGKRWYAPLNPGYNSVLLKSGSCIPRKNGETLRTVWNGNLASNPDGWGFISWNEIAENSHIKPMQKWGSRYLDVLSSLIGSAQLPVTGTFDDKNGIFAYSSSAWQDKTTDKAHGGSYKETTRSGSFVTLAFSGQSFSIIYKGGVTYGKMKIYIDDVLVHTLDQKLLTETHQKRWDYSGQLSAGSHILKLVFEPVGETVNRGSLDAVIIR